MLRFINVEGCAERQAILAQTLDFGKILSPIRKPEFMKDKHAAICFDNLISEAESRMQLICQLLRHLKHRLAVDEITIEEAIQVTILTSEILVGIGSGTNIDALISQLAEINPAYPEMVRVACTIDCRFPGGNYHAWASLHRNSIPAVEWIHAMDAATILTPVGELTYSQQQAAKRLLYFWNRKRSRQSAGGVWMRPIPLIIGPTGVGKSTVILHFCHEQNLPMLHLNSSAWVITGAYSKPWTLQDIRDFISHNEYGVLFLDELDKFHGKDSAWERHIVQEVMGLLDNRVPEWTPEERRHFHERILVVGAGTWQQEFRKQANPLGFSRCREEEFVINHASQSDIPEELIRRFNPNMIVIGPPMKGEIIQRVIQIHSDLGIPSPNPAQLKTLAGEAIESGAHARWLEGYLARTLDSRDAANAAS